VWYDDADGKGGEEGQPRERLDIGQLQVRVSRLLRHAFISIQSRPAVSSALHRQLDPSWILPFFSTRKRLDRDSRRREVRLTPFHNKLVNPNGFELMPGPRPAATIHFPSPAKGFVDTYE
jgi:hypothetical protein